MKKTFNLLLVLFAITAQAQIVNIPDSLFKQALLNHGGSISGLGIDTIDTNKDNEIQVSEANNYTGVIKVTNMNISDLTGIEAFTQITQLNCNYNNLKSLNLSANTALVRLHCGYNDLTHLNLNSNTALTHLGAYANYITDIDLTNNTQLTQVLLEDNRLTTIDLRMLSALTDFKASRNAPLRTVLASNGNNSNVTRFQAIDAPLLNCVEVDAGFNPVGPGSPWAITPGVGYSNSCNVWVSSIAVQGQGGDSTVSMGSTLQMEAIVLPKYATDVSYTWSVSNQTGSATIDNNGLLTAISKGIVVVKATANDSSAIFGSDTISITNKTTAINDISFHNLKVYPNPSNDIINIEAKEVINSIKLFSIAGKEIKVFNANQKQLDIRNIHKGIYFLELKNKEKKSIIKLIKQ